MNKLILTNFCISFNFQILSYNQKILPTMTLFTIIWFLKVKTSLDVLDKAITGFVIDNFDSCLIFLEGLQGSLVHQIYESIHRNTSCRIYFSSSYTFQERLYPELIVTATGVFGMVLAESLQNIYKKVRTYIDGYMPKPCHQVSNI